MNPENKNKKDIKTEIYKTMVTPTLFHDGKN